ncbi:MAG: cardiolipin synthase [Rhodospirillaceae bacterium]|nr:cardiolipin synthase [Rhodospirillaceae bacterium]
MTWAFALAFGETVWILAVGTWILLEKRPPVATLAWIFGLIPFPLVGAVFYFVWGPRKFERRKRRIRRARGVVQLGAQSRSGFGRDDAGASPLRRLAQRLGGHPPATASALRLFSEGDQFYAALEAAIRGAHHHVHLEYYIVRDDTIGGHLMGLLAERARSGIEVRLLADALGSGLPHATVRRLAAAGVRFARFNPTVIARLGRRIVNFRSHRKIAVIDGLKGFVGGTNICDDHSRRVKGGLARCDTDIEIAGEAVQGLQHTFFENWLFATREDIPDGDFDYYFPRCAPGEHAMQVIPSGPDSDTRAIFSFLLAAIGGAQKRVWLTTPYFVPDETLTSALTIAAARGVDVEIIIPKESDWRLVDAAGASSHDDLLRAGVKLFLFGPPLLHAKTAVIDDEVGVVGTANLDDRSLKLNFEVAVACYGGAAVRGLADLFVANRERSVRKLNFEADAPLPRRLLQAGARLLSPQL